jgi:RHS repeat-associated protein
MSEFAEQPNDPADDTFRVSVPSLSLPKGGGAIHGMGEKFSANSVTGTGSMSVPIATSPGRSGFGPQLELSYDSGAGNGIFGLGWNLSLPAITRKTDKGLPRYQDVSESDIFILSGAEDLVPVLTQTPPGQRVRDTGPRVVNGKAYLIVRYRPRVEGLFAQIERWTNSYDTTDVFWRSISKDNITTWYGKTAESRIADPADPTRVFSWLSCESYDDKGNVVVYGYKAEDSQGVDTTQLNERNRHDTARSANRYLKRIRYGNRAPYYPVLAADQAWPTPPGAFDPDASPNWLFELVLDYGEHDPAVPLPTEAQRWTARHDPHSSYRSRFEIRTYRRCKRVLMFHHFPDQAEVGANCLVRSTNFSYSDTPTDPLDPIYSFLLSAQQVGYRRDGAGYTSKAIPPLEFEYTSPTIDETVRDVDAVSLENLPAGLADECYHWVDLNGEGSAGILTEQAGAWYYKPNWSAANRQVVNGDQQTFARFGPMQVVRSTPSLAFLGSGKQQLVSLSENGLLDLVRYDGPTPGFFERTEDLDWEAFATFPALPAIDWNSPNLKFIDLTGDGLPDLLISESDAFWWHESLAKDGFGPAQRVAQSFDEEKGPKLIFADGTESILLADMSGDGLTDLVRVRNGEVCYWPNLGYGRFGAKVGMDNPPWFEAPDLFDGRRIRLADIDGSGTSDLIYFGSRGTQLYFNLSGNAWSAQRALASLQLTDKSATAAAVDLLGNGTACLVWSFSLPTSAQRPIRYVKLMGENKPHLLVKSINNMGAETRISYAPSTKFYLQDKLGGHPWITRLPFPVHVVERIESIDHISRHRFATRYEYHHGYFDGEEREFRGFGMVEQWDTEAFEDYLIGIRGMDGTQELTPELFQPPVTTRTWFHTGAFIERDRVLHQFRHEYYQGQQHIPEPSLPAGLNAEELRECARALRGLPVRQEIYSFDGSQQEKTPYWVIENNFEVQCIQPRGGQRHGIFLPVAKESISLNYERNTIDPRISHTFRLEVDQYDNIRKLCSVVYGRKAIDPALPPEVTSSQQQLYITYREIDYTPDLQGSAPSDVHRLRVPFESRSYEITGVLPAADVFQFEEIKAKIGTTALIDYEVIADGGTAQSRLLSQNRTLFLDNSLKVLPLGQWDTLGLPYQSFKLAFTPGTTAAYYGAKLNESDFAAASYIHLDGDSNWWIPSATAIYPDNPGVHFYLSMGVRDPLGVETVASRDQYDLLTERVEIHPAPWNVVTATNDYRVLGPVIRTDPNRNRVAVEHDELGIVVKTAIMGKDGSTDGDTLDDPTTRMEYDLFNWMNNNKPNYFHTFARERHGIGNPRWQESYTYCNGSGSVAVVKAQAHPGKAFKVNPDGTKTEVDADPRWVGNGRSSLNNKGKPVKQYEPYFSTTNEFEDEEAVRKIGVTPILFYDPLGRHIRTLFPNGTFAHVELTPWLQRVFDANDTVIQSQWYSDRGSPNPETELEPMNDPERRAAWLAAKHADTPGLVHFDSLGRPSYVVSDYGSGKMAAVRSERDLTGRLSKIFDQLQREVATGFVGMAGTPVLGQSAERGARWTFHDVLGAVVKTWDEHGRQFRTEYDALHRPVASYVQETGRPEILYRYVVYGDRVPDGQHRNLLGVAHQIFDEAGVVGVPELDFKGNPVSVDRVFAKDYKNDINWSTLAARSDYASIQASANLVLDTAEVFSASSQYDALNRPTQVVLPDATVILPTYNEANLLASLRADIRGQGNWIEFLKDQDYDAKGQRQYAHYANDLVTRYFYDPNTFRLTNLLTYRSTADSQTQGLQDLKYTYDPVGNITQIRDDAQQTNYFQNTVVRPESLYEYDAIYQLVLATGRELAGLGNNSIPSNGDLDFVAQLPHANDANAVRIYTEEYEYDLLGNIKILRHRFQTQLSVGSGWTCHYRYAFEDTPGNRTNRLSATSMPGDPDLGPYSATYDYDVYGNMVRMPHLAAMDWNSMDELRRVDLGGGGTAYYVYGLGGQRLRKVIERNGNVKLEWIFLGATMIFRRRRRDTDELRLERWTTSIRDNTGNIAQVDTKTRDDDNLDPDNPLNVPVVRYQYANHLGSAVLETDENGEPISYEEYHPYGTTAYRSAKTGVGISLKRYRFSGKERDDESGFYYFGARYYAPWLARWASGDHAGFVDGLNLYRYCGNSPSMNRDAKGENGKPKPLSPVGRVSWEIPGWVFKDKSGVRLSDAQTKANFENWMAKTHPDRPFTPGSTEIDWSTMTGRRGPTFNAEWLDPKTNQPLLPRKGEWGSVEPMRKQPKAEYGDPADKSTRLTENEHGTPRAQNEIIDPNYDDKAYRDDATVRSPRDVSLDKTRGDNAASDALKDKAAAGESIDVTEEIDMASNARFHAANDAAGQPIRPGSINRGTLEQVGNRFEAGKGTLPPSRLGTVVKVGGYGLLGVGTIYSAYAFGKDIERGNWVGAALNATGFAGGGLVLGGSAVGSTTLVTAGMAIGAPAAVVGSAFVGWEVGTYINENTGISDTAMSVGEWAEGWSGNTVVGATFAAGSAIVTSPYYAAEAAVDALGDAGSWLGGKIYDWFN